MKIYEKVVGKTQGENLLLSSSLSDCIGILYWFFF